MLNEPLFQFSFVVVLREREKIKNIRVFQGLLCEFGLCGRKSCGKIGYSLAFAPPKATFNLMCQDTAAPAMSKRGLHVIQGFILALAFGDNRQIMPPGDTGKLRNRLFRNLGSSLLPCRQAL